MTEPFDPYYKWLGISPAEQPPHHYRLLGLRLFESDAEVISNASDQRLAHVRTLQSGRHSALSQKLLNELSAATVCLLHPQQKADYDQRLRTQLSSAGTAPPAVAAPRTATLPHGHGAPARVIPIGTVPATPVAAHDSDELTKIVGALDRPHFYRRGKKQLPAWLLPALIMVVLAGGGAIAGLLYNRSPQHLPFADSTARTPDLSSSTSPADAAPTHVADSQAAETGPAPDDPALRSSRLVSRVHSWMEAGHVRQTKPVGGGGGSPFKDVPLGGGLLVGLKISSGNYAGHKVVKSMQPIFLTAGGLQAGEEHGKPSKNVVEAVAKQGYAIGAINVRSGQRIDGLEIIFMRVTNGGLDANDIYRSDWIAGQGGGGPTLLGGDGNPVIGIFGGVGAEFDRIGLVQATPTASAGK